MTRIGRWLERFGLTVGKESQHQKVSQGIPEISHASRVNALLADGAAALARCAFAEAERAFVRAAELQHDCARAHHGLGRLRLREQRFEDAADELQLAVFFDQGLATAHADLALALAHQSMNAEAREAADRAIRHCEDSATVWSVCAHVYKTLGDFERAAAGYETALRIDPGDTNMICQLGYVRFLHGAYDLAREAYQSALARDSNHVASLHNLGLLELEMGLPSTALSLFEQANERSRSAETQACIGHALRDLGKLDDACTVYEKVLSDSPEFGDAQINLSYALLMRGDYGRGWVQYDSRFRATGVRQRDFHMPTWSGDALTDRRLLIFAEQGIGDEIMFASCIPDAMKAAKGCVIECNTRLARLFARSFKGAHVHGGEKGGGMDWLSTMPVCDVQIAVGSLPRYFRGTLESFADGKPYLKADPHRTQYWRQRLRKDNRVSIGFSWQGGTLRTRHWQRSIPLQQWAPLLELADCQFVALQHGSYIEELAQVSANQKISITDLSEVCADIDDLAAVVSSLDLIITVPNTLAHLAGAIGQKVWVLLPRVPEWRYPRSGTHMPWYGSMRLYHRTAPKEAADLIAEAHRDLLIEMPLFAAKG